MKKTLLFFIAIKTILTAPTDNFVVQSTEKSKDNVTGSTSLSNPIIYDMGIESNVTNRFARTLIISRVKNPSATAQETTFSVILPEQAFISEFVLQIEGKEYKAYVREKEEAKQIYEQAIERGQTAGHVSASARDSNKFTVSVNVEPEAKATFLLTYEELLERKNNQYELVVNIHPGQVVDNLHVQVYINESRPLAFVRTPSLRSGNEIETDNENLAPFSDIKLIAKEAAVVKFTPTAQQQKQFSKELGTNESEGLSGQFVIQYDVERDPYGGEVLFQDGYFVHFFAPDNLPVLPKYIVFVLDTSSSMSRRKIDQLKDAMKHILDQLKTGDYVSLIEFNSDVYGWDIDTESRHKISFVDHKYSAYDVNIKEVPRRSAVQDQTITKSKNVIQRLVADGGTNIIDALQVALASVLLYSREYQETGENVQPIIMFLTDGEPNVGISDTEEITRIITKLNLENKVPIYSLSFGSRTDKKFLRKLSQKNYGFSRHIYEASDASLQLQNFYKEISSPLLSNIEFRYNDAINVTVLDYPVLYKGSEIIVGGYYKDPALPTEIGSIDGISDHGNITLKPLNIGTPVSSLKRLWAYLTVKQKLNQRDLAQNKEELTKEALDLALKYSFVTDVTSLVVVKPNDTQRVTLETARPDDISIANRHLPSPPLTSVSFDKYYSFGGPAYYATSNQPASEFDRYDLRFRPSYDSPFIYENQGYANDDRSSWSYDPASVSGLRDQSLMFRRTMLPPTSSSTTPATLNTKQSLSWLTAVLNPNGTLTVKGALYKIEENYQSSSSVECPHTPLSANNSGTCKLLTDCPEVHSYLTNFQVYQQYFCPIDNLYAGVCCPKKVIQ